MTRDELAREAETDEEPPPTDLDALRRRLSAIDQRVAALLRQRFEVVWQIGAHKLREGLPCRDEVQEERVIARGVRGAGKRSRFVWEEIIRACVDIQTGMGLS